MRLDPFVPEMWPGAPTGEAPAAEPATPPTTPFRPDLGELGVLPGGTMTASERQSAARALRELEATEDRLRRTAQLELEQARGKLVQDLLPVLDNLDRTIEASHAGHGDTAMLQGVRMVRHQLEGVLRNYGAERIDALDQVFDPGLHEAIGVINVGDARRHGVVVHQAEPGYRFAGKLLRPAKVSVGKLHAAAAGARPLWR